MSEIRYTYGKDIPSAFITFKQTGNTKQVVFSFGNDNKVYNVSANGYLSPAKGMGLQQQKFYAVVIDIVQHLLLCKEAPCLPAKALQF